MSSSKKDETVIELSVEETNKLRAQLGLAPLRMSAPPGAAAEALPEPSVAAASSSLQDNKDSKVLELSVDESNALRAKLGLVPLRTGSNQKPVIHAPAVNEAEQRAAAERIEQAKLTREIQEGMSRFAETKSLGEQSTSAQSWAAQMRQTASKSNNQTAAAAAVIKQSSSTTRYDQDDLKGMNVAHSMSELQEGATTVLTLADAPILLTRDDASHKVLGLNEDDDNAQLLENINLTEAQRRNQGLKEKRKLELGLGRAGGYAGFDDDEFEELGGTQAASRLARGGSAMNHLKSKVRGFQIGAHLEDQEEQLQSDLFAGHQGKAISLDNSQADVAASDFMTVEEDEALRRERKNKKEPKFKKQKKKSKKDKKKNYQRKTEDSDEDAEEETSQKEVKPTIENNSKGLLDELEETAVNIGITRKRRREEEDNSVADSGKQTMESSSKGALQSKADRRAKYDSIMAKGNERTRSVFAAKPKHAPRTDDFDEEPDDAFLNAALAKARRLNRLKSMAGLPHARGADAVVEAVKSTQAAESVEPTTSIGSGTVVFSVDETREFTRALRARTEQAKRSEAKKLAKDDVVIKQEDSAPDTAMTDDKDEHMEDIDLHELAKEVKEEEPGESTMAGLDGTTGSTLRIGRGVGSVLSILRQTGEMTRKNAGKEEMRGRAKDKKTYEDYEPLALSEVVRIDERTATAQDRDLASREIKLEYRDKYGRLLTRKEAFRDLSYQFHGYGSGKRKEEKRLQQIAREQSEARLASRQAAEGAGAGTFGALKVTQKATGRAWVKVSQGQQLPAPTGHEQAKPATGGKS